MDWFKIGKGICQGLFNLYAEYIMWNAGLDESQAGIRQQIVNICWIIKKAREFQKNIYFCFIDHAKAFDYVDHNKL